MNIEKRSIPFDASGSPQLESRRSACFLHGAILDPREKPDVANVPGALLGDRYTILVFVDNNNAPEQFEASEKNYTGRIPSLSSRFVLYLTPSS